MSVQDRIGEAGNAGPAAVRAQYERWPYPDVPLLARIRERDAWQGQVDYVLDRCGLDAPQGRRPRIWIAGCGTFEAYPFAVANPRARILATDWSRPSLAISRRRCWVQGIRHVEFREVDLEDPDAWPDETFDLIVCTGVLMNLRDPDAALRRLRDRLEPRGALRLMVYPHYSRQRIFWIQRVARALGLESTDAAAPARLRRLMTRALPRAHPLRRTFETYRDARNDAGVVDAFLHAGDRGFTGRALGALVHGAGLRAASFEHRPWGQPAAQAGRLGLDPERPFEVLHDLDLWQELRTNLLVTCVHQHAVTRRPDASAGHGATPLRPHPGFTFAGRGWRGRLELLLERTFGTGLPSRTHGEPLHLDGATLRAAARLGAAGGSAPTDAAALAILKDAGLVLGACTPAEDRLGPKAPRPAEDAPRLRGWHSAPLDARDGAGGPALQTNPLHAALFAAWCEAERTRAPDETLVERIARRSSPIHPLEDRTCPFGLTPEGSVGAVDPRLVEALAAQPAAPRDEDRGDEPPEQPDAVPPLRFVGRDPRAELAPLLASVPGLPGVGALSPRALLDCWCALVAWQDPVLEVEAADRGGRGATATAPATAAEPGGGRSA